MLRPQLFQPRVDAGWKRHRTLCHPERSRGICSSADLSWRDLSLGVFRLDGDLDVRGHFAMQFDRHMELAQLPQRLFQLQLAAVDDETPLLQLMRDLSRGDGAKEVIVLAHLA